MRSAPTTSREKEVWHNGPGVVTRLVTGLFPAVIGLGVIGLGIALFAGNAAGGALVPGMLLVIGCLCLVNGVRSALSPPELTLDKRAHRAIYRPYDRKEESADLAIEELKRVEISKELVVCKDGDEEWVFFVRIIHADGKLKLSSSSLYEAARKDAEMIARFLHVELMDSSVNGEPIVRPASELDESVRTKARRKAGVVDVPGQPEKCRSRCELGNGELRIEIPPPENALGCGIFVVVVIVFVMGHFGWKDAAEWEVPEWQKSALLALLYAALAAIPAWYYIVRANPERVIVTADELRLEFGLQRWPMTHRLAIDEIEEFELRAELNEEESFVSGAGGAIMARGDRKTIHFGRGLSNEEAKWIYALVKRVLMG